jgi:hypothetical protein
MFLLGPERQYLARHNGGGAFASARGLSDRSGRKRRSTREGCLAIGLLGPIAREFAGFSWEDRKAAPGRTCNRTDKLGIGYLVFK